MLFCQSERAVNIHPRFGERPCRRDAHGRSHSKTEFSGRPVCFQPGATA
jgi:hypothetical protein